MSEYAAPSIRRLRTERDPSRAHAWLEAQQARFATHASAHRSLVRRFAPERADRPGLLQGVALAHKDVFDMPHHRPGAGRLPDGEHGHRALAEPLARLHAAGALNMGCLTLSELCCGATGDNRHFGQPVNPLNDQAVVGGSSSGSAVAVAAGLCVASLGTDTAGSVRIPAASCGVIGLMPTHGRVDDRGVFRLAPSLDTVGLLARSASDAAHVWSALAEPAPLSPEPDESTRIQEALAAERPWRIGFSHDCTAVHGEIAVVLGDVRREFARQWHVVDRDSGQRARLNAVAQTVLHAEAAALHMDTLRAEVSVLPTAVRSILLPGLAIPSVWYASALEERVGSRDAFLRGPLWELDLLLTPAIGTPLPDWQSVTPGSAQYDPKQLLALHEHFPWINYLGLPAIVFPVGRDRRGLPVSIQAVGRAGSEHTLLAFAHQAMHLLGTSTDHHQDFQ